MCPAQLIHRNLTRLDWASRIQRLDDDRGRLGAASDAAPAARRPVARLLRKSMPSVTKIRGEEKEDFYCNLGMNGCGW